MHIMHKTKHGLSILSLSRIQQRAVFSNILYALYQAQTKGQAWGDEVSGVWGCFFQIPGVKWFFVTVRLEAKAKQAYLLSSVQSLAISIIVLYP